MNPAFTHSGDSLLPFQNVPPPTSTLRPGRLINRKLDIFSGTNETRRKPLSFYCENSPEIFGVGGMFSFFLTISERWPLRVAMTLVLAGEDCLRLVFWGTYRLSSDSEDGDDELVSLCLGTAVESSSCVSSLMWSVAGWFSSPFALNGVMWTVSSQSKSNVSLNPSDVLSLLLWGGGAAFPCVATRSRLLERALGLGFSQGFFSGTRSGLRPLSGFRGAGSGLERGCCCWVCFLPGCWCVFLGRTGSGVEWCNSPLSLTSTASGSAPGWFWFRPELSPWIGLGNTALRSATGSALLNRRCSCTRSERLLLLLSPCRRLTPTVDGRATSLSQLMCPFFLEGGESTEKWFENKYKSFDMLNMSYFN